MLRENYERGRVMYYYIVPPELNIKMKIESALVNCHVKTYLSTTRLVQLNLYPSWSLLIMRKYGKGPYFSAHHDIP